jgi:3-phosphoshikimate 1-carboxyvinyltransferase
MAPASAGPVSATVRVPGSKSITNRALVLAALADRPTVIDYALDARDTSLMIAALGALGARIERDKRDNSRLTVTPGPAARGDVRIDVGNAGTVLRFVPPTATIAEADVTFVGDARVSQRPIGPLLTALLELGAQISPGGADRVPFVVHGHGRLKGGTVTLNASSSSQLISGLLLAAPRFDAGARVIHDGPPVPSAPHIAMTVRMLGAYGADVVGDGPSWTVAPGLTSPGRVTVEPDLSNALPFAAAALVTGGEVTIAGWPADSLQPAERITSLLRDLGADVANGPDGLQVAGAGPVRGIDADLSDVGELTPVLTALASLADSPSRLRGIGHLRGHETDRLAALAAEIARLGGDVTECDDGLRVEPRPLSADGAQFNSHDDHRLVMAAAVLGLATGGLVVANAGTVAKTFPRFVESWERLIGS